MLRVIIEILNTLLGIAQSIWWEIKDDAAKNAKERLSDDPVGELNRLFNSHESPSNPRKTED